MALTYSQAQAVSSNFFDKTLTQTCFDKSAFWTRLKQENKVAKRGGNKIQKPFRYRPLGTSSSVNPTDQAIFEVIDTRSALEWDWKYYRANSIISWDERVKNTGDPQIVSLIKDKATEMQEDLYDAFASDLYGAQTALGLIGLRTMVGSGTYGGVAIADASTWVGFDDTATHVLALYGSASLSFNQNRATFGTSRPTLHVTTRNLYSKFMSLFEGQKIYNDNRLAEAGFDNIVFMGGPVVGDFYVTASYWYGLNIDDIEFVVHPDFDFKLTDWFGLEQAGHPESLARVISFAGNLTNTQRRAAFKYTDLDYTL